MPLDTLASRTVTISVHFDDSGELSLYRGRRERAAALWASKTYSQFDMRSWSDDCGSTACALGWLANDRFEGWGWGGLFKLKPRVSGHRSAETGAAAFFALYPDNVCRLFGLHIKGFSELYGKSLKEITGRDVGNKLLAMPYYIKGARHVGVNRDRSDQDVRVPDR